LQTSGALSILMRRELARAVFLFSSAIGSLCKPLFLLKLAVSVINQSTEREVSRFYISQIEEGRTSSSAVPSSSLRSLLKEATSQDRPVFRCFQFATSGRKRFFHSPPSFSGPLPPSESSLTRPRKPPCAVRLPFPDSPMRDQRRYEAPFHPVSFMYGFHYLFWGFFFFNRISLLY